MCTAHVQRRLCTQLNKGSELGADNRKDKARGFKKEGDPSKGQTLEPDLHSHPVRFGRRRWESLFLKTQGSPHWLQNLSSCLWFQPAIHGSCLVSSEWPHPEPASEPESFMILLHFPGNKHHLTNCSNSEAQSLFSSFSLSIPSHQVNLCSCYSLLSWPQPSWCLDLPDFACSHPWPFWIPDPLSCSLLFSPRPFAWSPVAPHCPTPAALWFSDLGQII